MFKSAKSCKVPKTVNHHIQVNKTLFQVWLEYVKIWVPTSSQRHSFLTYSSEEKFITNILFIQLSF